MKIPVDLEKVVPGLEAWAENFYTANLQHTLTLREVFKTHWLVRASRQTCQAD